MEATEAATAATSGALVGHAGTSYGEAAIAGDANLDIPVLQYGTASLNPEIGIQTSSAAEGENPGIAALAQPLSTQTHIARDGQGNDQETGVTAQSISSSDGYTRVDSHNTHSHLASPMQDSHEPTVSARRLNKGKGRAVEDDLHIPSPEESAPSTETLSFTGEREARSLIGQYKHGLTDHSGDIEHTSRPSRDSIRSLETVTYLMKSIAFGGESCPIVCQTINGACPIISIANLLSLSSGLQLPKHQKNISAITLTNLLADFLLMRDQDLTVLSELESLHQGLNVDPQFTGVNHFAEGQRIIKEFGGELVHGWIPSLADQAHDFLGLQQSESITTLQAASERFTNFEAAQIEVLTNADSVAALAINKFFLDYPNNMTPTGLRALKQHLMEGEMAILFYNSHSSLMYKHPVSGDLYTLVTDAGYIESGNDVVWESLVIDESSQFYSAEFIPRTILSQSKHENDYGQTQSIDQAGEEDEDAKLARQLHQEESGRFREIDLALAERLQQEENARSIPARRSPVSREETPQTRRQLANSRYEEDQARMDMYNGVQPEHSTALSPNEQSLHVHRAQSREAQRGTAARPRRGDDKKKNCLIM